MKKTLLTSVSMAIFLILSANAFGKECAGELVVPSMNCINLRGGTDVRLYIMEFQTCENGSITALDRSVLGMNVTSQSSVDDIHTINAENIEIAYAPKRVLIDPKERVDFLSFIMPKEVKMIDGETLIEMSVSDKLEADYEGASSTHFKGTFKVTKPNGKIVTGKLGCFVNR